VREQVDTHGDRRFSAAGRERIGVSLHAGGNRAQHLQPFRFTGVWQVLRSAAAAVQFRLECRAVASYPGAEQSPGQLDGSHLHLLVDQFHNISHVGRSEENSNEVS
jgi:hypothetical protein